MTGKSANGKGEMVNASSHSVEMTGGLNMMPTPEKRLYEEGMGADVHARGFWDIAEKAVKAVGKAVGEVADAPRRNGIYARTGGYSGNAAPEIYPEHDRVDLLDDYNIIPASQGWLQRITGKMGEYVFGASVDGGEDDGIYIDEELEENARMFEKSYLGGISDGVRKYAADFVEAALTKAHEIGHYVLGIEDEGEAEDFAQQKVYRMASEGSTWGSMMSDALGIAGYRQPSTVSVKEV